MRKLASLCRRLARQHIGYYAVVKDGPHHYCVYEGINRRMDLSEVVYQASSVSNVEWFLLGLFLEV